MHPGAVSMRVSFVLRSAEAHLVAQCISEIISIGNFACIAKNFIQLPELFRSSLRRGHANLLCIRILLIDGTARRRAIANGCIFSMEMDLLFLSFMGQTKVPDSHLSIGNSKGALLDVSQL